MDNQELIAAAKDELNLVLSFFPRVESRSSVVLAIDTGMAAFLVGSAPALHWISRGMGITAGITIVCLATSLIFLYVGSSPQLKGGEGSLVYFGEISNRTEHKFIEAFSAQSEKHYAHELLAQAWRNAKILGVKYLCLKWAFRFMAFAIIPWLVTLALFALNGVHSTLFKP